jgi:archaellum biogenesis protein FlaJ (TadC family)
LSTAIEWLNENQQLLIQLGGLSALIFVLSLLALPWLVAKIPEDYFVQKTRQSSLSRKRLSVFWLMTFLIKNLLGIILLGSGFLMLFLPGQGILTMFAGLLMIDYPGKYLLERKIVLHHTILPKLNWLRKKANQPPLKINQR